MLARWRGEVLRLLLAARRHDLQLQLARHQAASEIAELRRQLDEQRGAHTKALAACEAAAGAKLAQGRDKATAAALQHQQELAHARGEAEQALEREQRAAAEAAHAQVGLASLRAEAAAASESFAAAEAEVQSLRQQVAESAEDAGRAREGEQHAAARALTLERELAQAAQQHARELAEGRAHCQVADRAARVSGAEAASARAGAATAAERAAAALGHALSIRIKHLL